MKSPFLLLAFCAVVFLTNTANAVRMSTIYQAQVPVASQDVKERNRVLQAALSQVLVKVSGDNEVMDNPRVNSQLERAATLVQEFGYIANLTDSNKPFILLVQFDQNGINKILRHASIPIWGANRPLTLAWVEYEANGQAAEIIDNASSNKIVTLLKTEASKRGIPLIFPTMDVVDINNVNLKDIELMNASKLTEAAKRYNSDAILIMRVNRLMNGFSAQAKLVQDKNEWDWNIEEKTRAELFATLVNNMSEELTGRYAKSKKIRSNVTLTVQGILQESDYLQLMSYIRHIASVESVQVAKISGTNVTLKINLRSTLDSFMELLSLGNKLAPTPPVAITGPETNDNVVYQWKRS